MQRKFLSVLAVLFMILPVLAMAGIVVGPGTQPAEAANRPTRTPRPGPLPTATALSSPTPTALPSPTPGGGSGWSLVSSPNINGRSNLLAGLAGISGDDIWAVGEHRTSNGSNVQTLTMHWNGSTWDIVSSPNPDQKRNRLHGVAAVSSNDVWAVGQLGGSSGPDWAGLILHWNGNNWSPVPAPRPDTTGTSELRGVAALATDDVWAVGAYSSPATGWWNQPFIAHWDGSVWSTIPAPAFGSTSELNAVTAIAPDNVWAVGTALENNWKTLILHWDGATWTRIPSPNLGLAGNYLFGVGAVSAGEVWAVGAANNGNSTLTLHWDGAAWTLVPSPNGNAQPGINRNTLHSITGLSASDVWAVGVQAYSTIGQGGQPIYIGYALIEHWNGTAWQVVPAAGLPGTGEDGILRSVINLGPGQLWAAGSYYESALTTQAHRTLTQRYTQP